MIVKWGFDNDDPACLIRELFFLFLGLWFGRRSQNTCIFTAQNAHSRNQSNYSVWNLKHIVAIIGAWSFRPDPWRHRPPCSGHLGLATRWFSIALRTCSQQVALAAQSQRLIIMLYSSRCITWLNQALVYVYQRANESISRLTCRAAVHNSIVV